MMAILTYVILGLMVSMIIINEGTIVDANLNDFADKFVKDHSNADEESIRTFKTMLKIIWIIEWTLIWPLVLILLLYGMIMKK